MTCSWQITAGFSSDVVFTVGTYTFHPAAKVLLKRQNGVRLCLTRKEAAVLEVLCRAEESAVSYNDLRDQVWGRSSLASKHALQTHVYRLRQALEADPTDLRLLKTVRGGYRLNAATAMRVAIT